MITETSMEETLAALDFEVEEPRIRYSYKWRVTAEGFDLMLDYVFADNAAEAVSKAYQNLEIPPEYSVSVQRIPDVASVKLRLN